MQPKLNRSKKLARRLAYTTTVYHNKKFGGRKGVIMVILTYLQLLTKKSEIAGKKNIKIIIIKQT